MSCIVMYNVSEMFCNREHPTSACTTVAPITTPHVAVWNVWLSAAYETIQRLSDA
jgi:hypothetical protein